MTPSPKHSAATAYILYHIPAKKASTFPIFPCFFHFSSILYIDHAGKLGIVGFVVTTAMGMRHTSVEEAEAEVANEVEQERETSEKLQG